MAQPIDQVQQARADGYDAGYDDADWDCALPLLSGILFFQEAPASA
jgi:hypothetical protein